MSFPDYFSEALTNALAELQKMEAEQIAYSDTDEVMKYFEDKYFLPQLEKDDNRDEQHLTEPRDDAIRMTLVYPLKAHEKLGRTAYRRPSSRRVGINIAYMSKFNCLALDFQIPNNATDGNDRIMQNREEILRHINNVNTEVRVGNAQLGESILARYNELKKLRVKQLSDVNSWISKLPVKLVEVPNETPQIFRLPVNPKILAVITNKERPEEVSLDRNQVNTIIELMSNGGHIFERMPASFSKLGEEVLRDFILAGLNMHFRGAATGETFSKNGKTDIYLRVSAKDVLITECKKWQGEAMYKESIDQLFRYTIWRDSYGIIITFSDRLGFSEVIEKAKAETQRHPTYLVNSLRDIDKSSFVTRHIKMEDQAKQIEVHHLLFSLYSQ